METITRKCYIIRSNDDQWDDTLYTFSTFEKARKYLMDWMNDCYKDQFTITKDNIELSEFEVYTTSLIYWIDENPFDKEYE